LGRVLDHWELASRRTSDRVDVDPEENIHG
jgi:hypothetical protein